MLFKTPWPPEKVLSGAPQGSGMTGSGPGEAIWGSVCFDSHAGSDFNQSLRTRSNGFPGILFYSLFQSKNLEKFGLL